MQKNIIILSFLVILTVIPISGILADQQHYNDFLVGNRAAGMGGAYTAIADGPEGAYYNPAGQAFSAASYISLSTNAFQIKGINYKDVKPAPGFSQTKDYMRNSILFVPNFFGFSQRFGKTNFTFLLATTDTGSYDQRDSFSFAIDYDGTGNMDIYKIDASFNAVTDVTDFGPSFSWLINKHFSIGFNAFFRFLIDKFKMETYSSLYDGDDGTAEDFFSMFSRYNAETSLKFKPQIGVQWMPVKQLSIGYSLDVLIPLYSQFISQQISYSNNGGTVNQSIGVNQEVAKTLFTDGFYSPRERIKQTLGVAWFPSKSFILSADFDTYIPLPESSSNFSANTFTWNAALGGEWYLSPNFPLRFGIFSNRSNQIKNTDYEFQGADHVDYYGGSLSFGFETADTSVNLGLVGKGGFGTAQMVDDGSGNYPFQDVAAYDFSVFISGGYQF